MDREFFDDSFLGMDEVETARREDPTAELDRLLSEFSEPNLRLRSERSGEAPGTSERRRAKVVRWGEQVSRALPGLAQEEIDSLLGLAERALEEA